MTRAFRQAWVARTLAATLSLVLVVACIATRTAHASGGCLHLGSYGHHDSSATKDAAAATAHYHSGHGSGDSLVAADAATAPDAPEPDAARSGCADLVCHCGIAVLAASPDLAFASWSEARAFPWVSSGFVPIGPGRLDRPPKASVSA